MNFHVWPLNLKCFYSFSELWICSFRVGSADWRAPGHVSCSLQTKKWCLACISVFVFRFCSWWVVCAITHLDEISGALALSRAIQRCHALVILVAEGALGRKTPQYLEINCISADLLASSWRGCESRGFSYYWAPGSESVNPFHLFHLSLIGLLWWVLLSRL